MDWTGLASKQEGLFSLGDFRPFPLSSAIGLHRAAGMMKADQKTQLGGNVLSPIEWFSKA